MTTLYPIQSVEEAKNAISNHKIESCKEYSLLDEQISKIKDFIKSSKNKNEEKLNFEQATLTVDGKEYAVNSNYSAWINLIFSITNK